MDIGEGGSFSRVDGLESLARSGRLDFAVVVKLTRRERHVECEGEGGLVDGEIIY